MTTRFWHGVFCLQTKVVKVLADVPTLFHGRLSAEAPKLATPTKPAPPKKGETG